MADTSRTRPRELVSIPSRQDVGIAALDCAPSVALAETQTHVSASLFRLEQTMFVPGTKSAFPDDLISSTEHY